MDKVFNSREKMIEHIATHPIKLDANFKGQIGEIVVRGKVDTTIDAYHDIKYNSVGEQDLNTIMNCLSNTRYGKELANASRGKKIMIRISLETDPYI